MYFLFTVLLLIFPTTLYALNTTTTTAKPIITAAVTTIKPTTTIAKPITTAAVTTIRPTTTTTKAWIIACKKQPECPSTHFCNLKRRICILKHSLDSTCQSAIECLSGKCQDNICRKPCNSDNNCSLTKEFCTVKKYCHPKHCNACIRHAQCANNHCRFFLCVKSTCIPALNALRKQ